MDCIDALCYITILLYSYIVIERWIVLSYKTMRFQAAKVFFKKVILGIDAFSNIL